MKENEKLCELCGENFEVNLKIKRSRNKRFCSGTCAKRYNGLNNKGRVHTEECKKQMSERNSGEKNPFYGKEHSTTSKNKMSTSSQWTEDKYKYCNMNELEKEIFDGIMISDGSLNKSRISARLTLGFKYEETLYRIIEDLSSLKFTTPWNYKWVDKRTKNEYSNFYTKSNSYSDLLYEYKRWYKDDKKIIPNDVKLTASFFYWWYVCDGYISRDVVFLSTDNFEKKYVKNISDKINDTGFKNSVTTRNRIRFYKEDSERFLDWISEDIQIQEEYFYKWNIKK